MPTHKNSLDQPYHIANMSTHATRASGSPQDRRVLAVCPRGRKQAYLNAVS